VFRCYVYIMYMKFQWQVVTRRAFMYTLEPCVDSLCVGGMLTRSLRVISSNTNRILCSRRFLNGVKWHECGSEKGDKQENQSKRSSPLSHKSFPATNNALARPTTPASQARPGLPRHYLREHKAADYHDQRPNLASAKQHHHPQTGHP
jgi:hypothetical protein